MAVVVACPPDCGCTGCRRRARSLDRQAIAFAAAAGERLPDELNTARLSGDLSLSREKREALGRRWLQTLNVVSGSPNVESHAYLLEALEREVARRSTRMAIVREAKRVYDREIAEHRVALRILGMVRADRTGAEIARALGCSRPTAVERVQALLREAGDRYRRLPVVTVPCRLCGAPITYTMGGRRPIYCPARNGKSPCRQLAYWAASGSARRRELRGLRRALALRMARRKGRRRDRPSAPPCGP